MEKKTGRQGAETHQVAALDDVNVRDRHGVVRGVKARVGAANAPRIPACTCNGNWSISNLNKPCLLPKQNWVELVCWHERSVCALADPFCDTPL